MTEKQKKLLWGKEDKERTCFTYDARPAAKCRVQGCQDAKKYIVSSVKNFRGGQAHSSHFSIHCYDLCIQKQSKMELK